MNLIHLSTRLTLFTSAALDEFEFSVNKLSNRIRWLKDAWIASFLHLYSEQNEGISTP